jgi:enoyl-CoA hydratase
VFKYSLTDSVAVITMDDGKANAVGHDFVDAMLTNLEKAQEEASAVVLYGKDGMFSAGFDLKEFAKGQKQAMHLVSRGERMLEAMYSFPLPLVAAVTGHAIGLGAFLLLSTDSRVGIDKGYSVRLPETAIGMPFTPTLMSLVRNRIPLTHQMAAAVQAKSFTPEEAIAAGFMDELVSAELLQSHAIALAKKLGEMPGEFYAKNKRHLREDELAVMKQSFQSNG